MEKWLTVIRVLITNENEDGKATQEKIIQIDESVDEKYPNLVREIIKSEVGKL